MGLVQKGQECFESMSRDFGLSPSLEHYSRLADLLGRAGLVEKAFETIDNMPFSPDIALWRTVLGACQKWRRKALGKRAFECAVRLDMSDAASYVLMSNIYEAAYMVECKDEIQALLAKFQAFKNRGRSRWRDMDGVVHAFTGKDWENVEIQNALTQVENSWSKMKFEGDVPYLNRAREKPEGDADYLLCNHSERIAIAFALTKTLKGTTIRVVNDMPVCDDCHEVASIISGLVCRVIICRNSSRFHVHKGGKCNCEA